MLLILSPSKNMKLDNFKNTNSIQPIFKEKTLNIIENLKKFEAFELESLMKINKDLAFKTFHLFQDFNINKAGGHALLSYDGLVFKNICPSSFSPKEIDFAIEHVKIISGLYGLLSANSSILPYRLEMQCKVNIDNSKNLYNFWNNEIYKELTKNKDLIINLASTEYSKTISPYLNNISMINIHFFTRKNNKNKVIATNAKIARGKMVHYIVKNKIDNPNHLKEFDLDNYKFDSFNSDFNNFVFVKH